MKASRAVDGVDEQRALKSKREKRAGGTTGVLMVVIVASMTSAAVVLGTTAWLEARKVHVDVGDHPQIDVLLAKLKAMETRIKVAEARVKEMAKADSLVDVEVSYPRAVLRSARRFTLRILVIPKTTTFCLLQASMRRDMSRVRDSLAQLETTFHSKLASWKNRPVVSHEDLLGELDAYAADRVGRPDYAMAPGGGYVTGHSRLHPRACSSGTYSIANLNPISVACVPVLRNPAHYRAVMRAPLLTSTATILARHLRSGGA